MKLAVDWLCKLTIVLCMALSTPCAASAKDDGAIVEPEGEVEAEKRSEVEVFLGSAVRDDDGVLAGFALGASYNYRLFRYLSAGIVVETTSGSLRDVIVLGGFAAHPWRGLKLVAEPGVEISSEEGAEFVMRLGTAYHFDLSWFKIGPEFNVDLIKAKPTFVFGIAVGFEF